MVTYDITNDESPILYDVSEVTGRILQNGRNLLRCRLGEVPYDRSRGFDPRLYDLPLPQLQAQLRKEIDRVMIWEPRLRVVDAKAEAMADGTIRITVTVTMPRMEE